MVFRKFNTLTEGLYAVRAVMERRVVLVKISVNECSHSILICVAGMPEPPLSLLFGPRLCGVAKERMILGQQFSVFM